MSETDEERQRLLNTNNVPPPPNYTPQSGTGNRDTPVQAPIGPDELPPSYQDSGTPMITCRICQSLIDISEKRDQHVVKCNHCLEATPIRNAPPGKKYVRCPCNCLLICKSSSQRIACPRPNCKRIINLAPSPVSPPPPALSGMILVTCVHCRDTFLYRRDNNALARCPHCQQISAVGRHFARGKSILFGVASIVLLALGIGITVGTYRLAASSGGIYVVYVGAFILAFLAFCRAIYYLRMKTSTDNDV